MRITLLTNRDLASNFALNLLLPQLSSSHELHVFCSDRVGSKPAAPGLATASFMNRRYPWNSFSRSSMRSRDTATPHLSGPEPVSRAYCQPEPTQ